MLRKDDYVTYEAHGICKIEDIRFMKFDPGTVGREYYILKPVDQDNATIFVPLDRPELVGRMKPVLSPDEVDRVILSVRNEKMPWICDRKERTAKFQDILQRRDERELLLLAGCLHLRSVENEKGLSYADAHVLRQVETIISREFSFLLHLTPQETGQYIRKKLGLPEQISA